MSPSEFARLYRQVDNLTEEQAQMLARIAIRQITDQGTRWRTAEKILTGPAMTSNLRDLRDLQTTLAIRMQMAERAGQQ